MAMLIFFLSLLFSEYECSTLAGLNFVYEEGKKNPGKYVVTDLKIYLFSNFCWSHHYLAKAAVGILTRHSSNKWNIISTPCSSEFSVLTRNNLQ